MLYDSLFDIKRYAIHDGPGIRVTVFLRGCPLQCWWCHNPEGIRSITDDSNADSESLNKQNSKALYGSKNISCKMSVDQVVREIEKDVLFFDESGGGVTFSGGEPLVQSEFLDAVLRECKRREIHTAIDTTGYASSEILEQVMHHVDLFLYDLKLMDNDLHLKYTGVSNRCILENLKMLVDQGKNIAIRFPLIPGITDSDDNLSAMVDYLSCLRRISNIHILPFHNTAQHKYKRLDMEDKTGEILPPTLDQIESVKLRFEDAGLSVHIGG
jgi:pyruvate formate lyase activating enzyme